MKKFTTICQIFFIIHILMQAHVSLAISENAKQSLLNSAERQIILNQIYREFWKRIFDKIQYTDEAELHIDVSDIGEISFVELQAALFERALAIQINILCWRYALYYKLGITSSHRQTSLANNDNAADCAAVGQTLAWYNSEFSARVLVAAYKMSRSTELDFSDDEYDDLSDESEHTNTEIRTYDGRRRSVNNEHETFEEEATIMRSILLEENDAAKPKVDEHEEENDVQTKIKLIRQNATVRNRMETTTSMEKETELIYEFAKNIEILSDRLKKMNEIFVEAELNYDDIFMKLKNEYVNDEETKPIRATGADFTAECIRRLVKYFGEEYLNVIEYISSLAEVPGKVTLENLIPPWKDSVARFTRVMSTTGIKNSFLDVEKILQLERKIILVALDTENIPVPDGLRL